MIPWGEWKPDLSDFGAQTSATVLNGLPRADGYGPVSDLAVYTSALSAACRGYFYAINTDGSVTVFAGTSTKLYKLNNTNVTWTDVSLGASTYSALSSTDQWQFAQFNNLVFATQANAVLQVFDLTSSSAFANCAGSPPQSRYIAVVGRFLVLSGLLSNPYRVHWSGLEATTTWTAGTNSSDYQDLADGGIVRGVAGGEFGVIFQDASIRRMTFAPGSPVIFQIDRISKEDGIFAPYSLVSAGDRVFFISPQGFKRLDPGGYPVPIGKEKVDRTFFADVDAASVRLVLGASDPRGNRIYWAYKSVNGQTGLFDKIICYDWSLDRFSPISVTGEFISNLARPGITLEGLDSISSSVDALPFSLDDFSSTAFAQLSCVSSAHKLCFFTGDNLEATFTTPEQNGVAKRLSYMKGVRPITDAPNVYCSISKRENLQDTATYSDETAINAQGLCPSRVSTRYAKHKVRIPAGTAWTFAAGVEADNGTEGTR